MKKNARGESLDVFCACRDCGREFIARVYPAKNQVEYLKNLED